MPGNPTQGAPSGGGELIGFNASAGGEAPRGHLFAAGEVHRADFAVVAFGVPGDIGVVGLSAIARKSEH